MSLNDIKDDIKIDLSNNLDKLKEECKEYLDDSEYVYKICSNCIVVMKKLQDTRTNENRINVANSLYAKFRADKLYVVKIINSNNMELIKEVTNNNYYIKITYKCDEIIVPDIFDENINEVCSSGIHYFKTIDAAFYYRDQLPTQFTGKWVCWYGNGNGNKNYESRYIDGKKTGKWTRWYENGNKSFEGEYINDKKTGKWTRWYENGNKSFEGEYINDEKIGNGFIGMKMETNMKKVNVLMA